MASPPLLFSATVTLLDLLPAAPCSPLGHPSHPLDHPGRHTSLQLEGFKLQTSRKWISEQGLFFFLGGEADKAARLGSCCLGLLKTLGVGEGGGRDPLRRWWVLAQVWVPLLGPLPQLREVWGLPDSPLRSVLPFLTHLTDSLAQTPAQPLGLHRTMRPHL